MTLIIVLYLDLQHVHWQAHTHAHTMVVVPGQKNHKQVTSLHTHTHTYLESPLKCVSLQNSQEYTYILPIPYMNIGLWKTSSQTHGQDMESG